MREGREERAEYGMVDGERWEWGGGGSSWGGRGGYLCCCKAASSITAVRCFWFTAPSLSRRTGMLTRCCWGGAAERRGAAYAVQVD